MIFWALVLALLGAVDSFHDSCDTLRTFAIVGVCVGISASAADALLEVIQDTAYTLCNANHPCRARCSVPARYQKLSWLYGKACTCCEAPGDVGCAWFALFGETLIRAVGNASLFTVYVIGTLSAWTYKEPVQPTPSPSPDPTTAEPLVVCYKQYTILSWLETDSHALLIVTFVFLAMRILVSVSYPAREEPKATA